MLPTDSASSRVARGASLLDRQHPGWAAEINTRILVLYDCSTCLLGQLYGLYNKGLSVLGVDYMEASAYGFIREKRIDALVSDLLAEYAELSVCWKAEIASRLVPVPPKAMSPVAGPPSDLDAELFATLTAGGVGMLVGA